MKLSQLISEHLATHNLKVIDVYEKCGISQRQLYRIKTGGKKGVEKISGVTIRKLEKGLGIPAAQIIYCDDFTPISQ